MEALFSVSDAIFYVLGWKIPLPNSIGVSEGLVFSRCWIHCPGLIWVWSIWDCPLCSPLKFTRSFSRGSFTFRNEILICDTINFIYCINKAEHAVHSYATRVNYPWASKILDTYLAYVEHMLSICWIYSMNIFRTYWLTEYS